MKRATNEEIMKAVEKAHEFQERIITVQEQQAQVLESLKEKVEHIEGLDLSKYLKKDEEVDAVIDNRIASLLEISTQLRKLNSIKRDSILDYLSKKSGVGKTNLNKVIDAFETYLERLL